MKVDIIVKGILLNRKMGKVLLLKRAATDPVDPNEWENAGGKLEQGETLETAVRREIKEETGLEARVCNLAYLTYVQKTQPYLLIVYLCETDMEEVVLSHEHQDFIWADKEQCTKLLKGGIRKDFIKQKIYEMSWTDDE